MIDKLSIILYSYFIAFASEKGCVFAYSIFAGKGVGFRHPAGIFAGAAIKAARFLCQSFQAGYEKREIIYRPLREAIG